jgi:hypothetical protein
MICLRCMKDKRGVHLVVVLGTTCPMCNKCCTKVSNLLSLYKASKNEAYKVRLVYLMYHAVGFNHESQA